MCVASNGAHVWHWSSLCRTITTASLLVGLSCGELLAQVTRPATDQQIAGCDVRALQAVEDEFLRLVALRRSDRPAVTDQVFRQASSDYVAYAEMCYEALYGTTLEHIDDGGLLFGPAGADSYNLGGRKWGAGSPFVAGSNGAGPRIPGGTVTYSFMGSGISFALERHDASLALSSMPTYSSCFLAEIANAFAAWSAVADIQFSQVVDNGAGFNSAGATGDIRIAAHSFDGPSNVLAHAYYPPPNGTSASGDMHFDVTENWSCSAGAGRIDIGIVAVHEIGHAIGLGHEAGNPAIMQPFYNPGVTVPLADDINGAREIYGNPTPPPPPPPPPLAAANDFDGDGRTDIGVWRTSTGFWYAVRSSDGGIVGRQWGTSQSPYNDVPVPGDYDGDRRTDIAVWRRSTGVWYIVNSSDGGIVGRQWGASQSPYNDVPVPGDYDGDRRTDIAVWRRSTGVWYIVRSSDGGIMSAQWGAGYSPYDDVPVPGDYDGDRRTDVAVWRRSTGVWYVVRSSDNGIIATQWGAGSSPHNDLPVPGDYDGDQKTDVAVWRRSTGVWFIVRSSDNGIMATQWGTSSSPYSDLPVPGDYDGDRRSDVAVWRRSTGDWLIVKSSDGGIMSAQWGAGYSPYNDVPLAGDYDEDDLPLSSDAAPATIGSSNESLWTGFRSLNAGSARIIDPHLRRRARKRYRRGSDGCYDLG